MCPWGTHKTVFCPAGFNGNNPQRQYVHVDACIADLVQALNQAGLHTRDSCCGHGRASGVIRLMDGRELTIREGGESQ